MEKTAEKSGAQRTVASYEKEIYDLHQLLEISRSLCTTLELPKLIESILYTTMAQMRVISAGVFIKNSLDERSLALGNNYNGLETETNNNYIIETDSKLLQAMAQNGSTYTIGDLKKLEPGSPDIKLLESLKPSLIVPMMLKNHPNGILILGERINTDEGSSYDSYERAEISTIASLAAVAVNNASLVEQASTDLSTKLKLRHYFFAILADKLDTAFIKNGFLSVLMFDIDFFKKFNDNYGHACGDFVLQEVAKIIKGSIRGQDLASRYGGEEFTVLLNNTGKKEAMMVAERIRRNIELHDFYYQNQHMHVTISIGVTVFSTDNNPITSAKELVDQADKALYLSKRNGRNQVSFADPALLVAMEQQNPAISIS